MQASQTMSVAVDCDLQEFTSVRKAAEEVTRIVSTSGLDVLVNNAGARIAAAAAKCLQASVCCLIFDVNARLVLLASLASSELAARGARHVTLACKHTLVTQYCKVAKIDAGLLVQLRLRASTHCLHHSCPVPAGIMAQHDKPTKDGYEQQAQTNHLSHFLLTSLLMSSLEKAAAARGQARVVNHSSAARKLPASPLVDTFFKKGDSFGGDGFGARIKRYQQSKLANVVFTLALQVRAAQLLHLWQRAVLCIALHAMAWHGMA